MDLMGRFFKESFECRFVALSWWVRWKCTRGEDWVKIEISRKNQMGSMKFTLFHGRIIHRLSSRPVFFYSGDGSIEVPGLFIKNCDPSDFSNWTMEKTVRESSLSPCFNPDRKGPHILSLQRTNGFKSRDPGWLMFLWPNASDSKGGITWCAGPRFLMIFGDSYMAKNRRFTMSLLVGYTSLNLFNTTYINDLNYFLAYMIRHL